MVLRNIGIHDIKFQKRAIFLVIIFISSYTVMMVMCVPAVTFCRRTLMGSENWAVKSLLPIKSVCLYLL
jgi:hypothetical protein